MISVDISAIGMVFTLILFIIFFSALVLYIAFRIKETFREEKRTGAMVTKILFLIGILFLAGGGFYFFAETIKPSVILTPSTDNDGKPQLSLSVSYPSSARRNRGITVSFVITNPTEYTAHEAVIQTNLLLQQFKIESSTHEVVGNTIQVGDIPQGTVTVSLELITPNQPTEINDTITLTYQEATQPITQDISISITRR